ncbi:MAG: hypothetical protein SGPRY_000049 [Prymnesium sp.]
MWPPIPTPSKPSRYQSLGKLKHFKGGDLEKPGELGRAVAARQYNDELILTYGNEAGTAWIANLVFSLRAAGIDHYLVIVMNEQHCKALSRPPWMISCAWSSWDFGNCSRKLEMRRLWYSRHHYMSRVIEETGVNVAVIDGDMSVRRNFYELLKGPPLDQHNLIYTLDHSPACGDLNVGFAYCQRCASRGRAQARPSPFSPLSLSFLETLSTICISTRAALLLTLYAYLRFVKQVVDQYAFMRQWGQDAKCSTMHPAEADGLQTWYSSAQAPSSLPTLVSWCVLCRQQSAETLAIATGALASGWHGTGAGELSGWSGHWLHKPPAIAHFVGGAPAGGKVDIMQGLSWWLYEADVVAHAVHEETGNKAGMALPRSFFSPRTQRGLLAVAGPSAIVRIDDRMAFTQQFIAFRFWLLQATPLSYKWIPSDEKTGNRGRGYKGKWYTPGWPWPFEDGVGVVVGACSYLNGSTTPSSPGDCCNVIFGKVKEAKVRHKGQITSICLGVILAGSRGVQENKVFVGLPARLGKMAAILCGALLPQCLDVAHHMLLEQTLHRHQANPKASAKLDLTKVMDGDALSAPKLRELAQQYSQPVLWIAPEDIAHLPRLVGLSEPEKGFIKESVSEQCTSLLAPLQ